MFSARVVPLQAQPGRIRPGPACAQNRPKMAQNRPNGVFDGPEKGANGVHGHDLLGRHVGCLVIMCRPFSAPNCGPIGACSGPNSAPQSETKNWPYLSQDGPNSDPPGAFSPRPPPRVGSTHWNGPNAPPDVVCAHRVPVWPRFWTAGPARAPTRNGSGIGPKLVVVVYK